MKSKFSYAAPTLILLTLASACGNNDGGAQNNTPAVPQVAGTGTQPGGNQPGGTGGNQPGNQPTTSTETAEEALLRTRHQAALAAALAARSENEEEGSELGDQLDAQLSEIDPAEEAPLRLAAIPVATPADPLLATLANIRARRGHVGSEARTGAARDIDAVLSGRALEVATAEIRADRAAAAETALQATVQPEMCQLTVANTLLGRVLGGVAYAAGNTPIGSILYYTPATTDGGIATAGITRHCQAFDFFWYNRGENRQTQPRPTMATAHTKMQVQRIATDLEARHQGNGLYCEITQVAATEQNPNYKIVEPLTARLYFARNITEEDARVLCAADAYHFPGVLRGTMIPAAADNAEDFGLFD